MMKTSQLKIIKQKRLYISIVALIIGLFFCVILSLQLKFIFFKIAVPIVTFGSLVIVSYYFTVGHLKITFKNGELDFSWKPKPIFNFKKYTSIKVSDITAIIIQEETYVTQLETKNVKIELSGLKSNKLEYTKLLTLLRTETNIKPKDTWDVIKEQGWIKVFYIINLSVLIIAILVIIIFIILKGFDSKLLFFPLFLGALFTSHLHMREKLKK